MDLRRPLKVTGLGVVTSLSIMGCCEQQVQAPETPSVPSVVAPAVVTKGAVMDPIGPKPPLGSPKAFDLPPPSVFNAANGMTVWLVERHSLPIVSASLAIPYGAASDPKGKAGLAHVTAEMLDEGAGPRNAVEVSTGLNDLGAALGTSATLDGTIVSLTVLKKNFKPAFDIFSDVVARPRFEASEWKRVSALWKNDLNKRAQDPSAVARVVMSAALYGIDSPYGHPSDGLLAGATAIDLGAVKAFYATHYRPDKATLIVAGDVTQGEVTQAIEASLGTWAAPKTPPAPLPVVIVPEVHPALILVDRPDAPQSVIGVVREGVAAHDESAPKLDLINTALGGSFTSRLNQDLREDHGWSYGARSAFTESRGQGTFVARASVMTEATGQALKAMIADLDKMAKAGLSDAEIEKVKAQDRAELVRTYESVSGVSKRLATLAILGLPPGFDAIASRTRQQATKPALDLLGPRVSPSGAIVVVVGPKAAVAPQLATVGLGGPEIWSPEGTPAKEGSVKVRASPAKASR